MNDRQSKSGHTVVLAFTLMELLVVISIITLLGGLLLPALSSAKQKAQSALCMHNSRQLAQAFLLYASDGGIPNNSGGDLVGPWMLWLNDYYGRVEKIRRCPSTKDDPTTRNDVNRNWDGTADLVYKQRLPPALRVSESITNWMLGSYSINMWLFTRPSNERLTQMFFREEGSVTSPSLTPVFADAAYSENGPISSSPPARDLYYDQDAYAYPVGIGRLTLARHGGRTARRSTPVGAGQPLSPWLNHLSFYDGHVERAKLDNLWQYHWHKNYVPPTKRPE